MTAPRIETERLVLRDWRREDFAPLAEFFADEAATAFIGGTEPPEEVHLILCAAAGEWTLHGVGKWAVEEKTSSRLAGFAGCFNPPDWPEPELGWSIFPAFQGRGFATEASRAARAGIARRGGPKGLVSYVHRDNAPSARVAWKLGAVRDEAPVRLRGVVADVWRHPELTREGEPA